MKYSYTSENVQRDCQTFSSDNLSAHFQRYRSFFLLVYPGLKLGFNRVKHDILLGILNGLKGVYRALFYKSHQVSDHQKPQE